MRNPGILEERLRLESELLGIQADLDALKYICPHENYTLEFKEDILIWECEDCLKSIETPRTEAYLHLKTFPKD